MRTPKSHRRYYGERAEWRQVFRDMCFVHYASGHVWVPVEARVSHLQILISFYSSGAVRRNIRRIKRAMRKAEGRAREEATQ